MTEHQLDVILHKLSRIKTVSFKDIILKDDIKKLLLEAMKESK